MDRTPRHYLKRSIEILKQEPKSRSLPQIEFLLRATEQIPFFKSLTEKEKSKEIHIECCKRMEFLEFEAGSYVFKQGDVGDALFIILEGEVSVEYTQDRSYSFSDKAAVLSGDSVSLPVQHAVLYSGSSFGEMALLNDRLRSASIVCLKRTRLARLSKEDFSILSNVYQKDYTEKLRVLKNLPAFHHWAKVSLQKISRSLVVQEFKRGRHIYNEGDTANKIYIMKSGQAKIIKNYCFQVDNTKVHSLNRIKKNEQFKCKELQVIIKETMFGFEDIMNNTKLRTNSCVAVTDTTLYTIGVDEFNRILQNKKSRVFLEGQCKVQGEWQNNRIEKLKEIEKFKDKASYIHRRNVKSDTIHDRTPSRVKIYQQPIVNTNLPRILSNLYSSPRNTAAQTYRKSSLADQSAVFVTSTNDTRLLSAPMSRRNNLLSMKLIF